MGFAVFPLHPKLYRSTAQEVTPRKEKRKNPDLKTEEIVSYKAARRSRRPKTNNPKTP
jgi:hypothetical protein